MPGRSLPPFQSPPRSSRVPRARRFSATPHGLPRVRLMNMLSCAVNARFNRGGLRASRTPGRAASPCAAPPPKAVRCGSSAGSNAGLRSTAHGRNGQRITGQKGKPPRRDDRSSVGSDGKVDFTTRLWFDGRSFKIVRKVIWITICWWRDFIRLHSAVCLSSDRVLAYTPGSIQNLENKIVNPTEEN